MMWRISHGDSVLQTLKMINDRIGMLNKVD
jgi:hypothetical protein